MPINSFDEYPMSWKPDIRNISAPLYIAIAHQLEQDIKDGKLMPGTKLPPQRELADFLDVNLSTITRAFKLCGQKGFIYASIGSGTFVSTDAASNKMLLPANHATPMIEMGSVLPDNLVNDDIARFMKKMLNEPSFSKLFQYGRPEGNAWQNEAVMKLFELVNFQTDQPILLGAGGQNAIVGTLAALFQPGDRIGTDPITYAGIKTAANMLGIQLVAIQQCQGEMTREGLLYACKNEHIKGIYVIPDFHNPTTHTMSVETRKMIAEVARQKDLLVIEDAIYSFLKEQPLAPIASFAPDKVIYIASLSKTLSPGLRLSFLVTPSALRKKIMETLYNINISVSPLMLELAARLIHEGVAQTILEKHRAYAKQQNALVNKYLGDYDILGEEECIFRWLYLPDKFTGVQFELLASKAGVQVYAAERFAVGNTKPVNAVRLAIAAPEAQLEQALIILKDLLESNGDYAFVD
ncbi:MULTISPECIES: PLP-dependent aminotransferase family protein [Lysinibacillus]|jgi:DNA-binding transcriptional MocR family regulator|uniref:PLP-dependent aminotransferase family protein n=1 Tax=Lysinibacillus fusiformis TaxID=28031 RepID=A0A2I0V0Q3_9BACI|nr:MULTISPECIES: PLP-dependent aminotransferase family protein [Lysinibacillus]KUF31936.1 GntR family transcriptional regulator [Lysinibacillus sp. F5]MEE3806135.1 PLP-dependent aminotransferase family protein [Lysinibacillus fusiformis]PKU51836.1 PLP-dependent aminotransferase family protein [Lysinibacillus fusiformis]SCZ06801.1 transcriptional regulator, GntR family [Lysinibacillus sp. SG9]SDB52119.1 transcriptional regulator, GntR family [Lysinibacillus sp. TC-37]